MARKRSLMGRSLGGTGTGVTPGLPMYQTYNRAFPRPPRSGPPPEPAQGPEAIQQARSVSQIAPGCYEIAGTWVHLRELGNINYIKASLNTPDQVYADGYAQGFYIRVTQKGPLELHTFARVMVTSGPARDSSGWVAVEYLRACTRPPMGEAAGPGQRPLTAAQALVTSQRLQATQATQAGGQIYGRRPPPPPGPQVRPIEVHGVGANVDQQQGEGDMTQAMQLYQDEADLMQFAAGLGAITPGPEGFGAIGNIGNRSDLAPGKYEVSGDGVNVRPSPSFATAPKTTLNTGDVVQATGKTDSDESPGTDPNFPKGVSVNFAEIIGPVQGWIAVGYLDRLGTGRVAARPGTQPPPVTGMVKSKLSPTTMLLIAAGALGVGIVGYAVYRSSKRGKARAA